MKLVDNEFFGLVLPDLDSTHQGLYKVNIPQLFPNVDRNQGIWVRNNVCKYRATPSSQGIYGSYYPLQPGTYVSVKFLTENLKSGYIDRIISDIYPESLPLGIIERDDYYQIIRTPKNNNLIVIYEGDNDAVDEGGKTIVPKNSIHIYYNSNQSVVVVDSSGVHIITTENVDVRSDKTLTIQSNETININAGEDINIQAVGNINIRAGVDIKNQANENISLLSGVNNFFQATTNQLAGVNRGMTPSGNALPALPILDEAGEVTTPPLIDTRKEYDYFKRTEGD